MALALTSRPKGHFPSTRRPCHVFVVVRGCANSAAYIFKVKITLQKCCQSFLATFSYYRGLHLNCYTAFLKAKGSVGRRLGKAYMYKKGRLNFLVGL